MRRYFLAASLVVIISSNVLHAGGIEDDISEMKKDISSIKKDMSELKGILKSITERQPPALPDDAEASIDDDPMLGNTEAKVTIIEFSDYECPYCSKFSKDTFPDIKKNYIDKGLVRYVLRDFPLPMHKSAVPAAQAANCAFEQNRYWEMHDELYKNNKNLNEETFNKIASNLNFDVKRFKSCLEMNAKKSEDEIMKDAADGINATVKGTPSFIIGVTNSTGKIHGKVIRGAVPFEAFRLEIDKVLKSAK